MGAAFTQLCSSTSFVLYTSLPRSLCFLLVFHTAPHILLHLRGNVLQQRALQPAGLTCAL
jgi:hypothetical protein